MFAKKLNIIIVLLVFLSSFTQITILETVKAQEDNVVVHVDLIQTYANGSYTSRIAYLAQVAFTNTVDTNITYVGYTDENGNCQFEFNLTGMYLLNITLLGAYYIPREVHVMISERNVFSEKIFVLAKFFGGDQETLARVLVLELPASLVLGFPKNSNLNVSVSAYGLGWRQYGKGEDGWYTFEPIDICNPIINPRTGEFIPTNYTLKINITTVEEGVLTFTATSNGTIIADFPKFYFVPKEVEARFELIIYTRKQEFASTLEDIDRKLDALYNLLIELLIMHNSTIIPTMNSMDTKIDTRFNQLSLMIATAFENSSLVSVLIDKISGVDITTKAINDRLGVFTSDYVYQIKRAMSEIPSGVDYRSMLDITLFAIGLFIVIVRTRKEEKTIKETDAGVLYAT